MVDNETDWGFSGEENGDESGLWIEPEESAEPDETSDEVLKQLAHQFRRELAAFGVDGANNSSDKDIIELWHAMDMSHFIMTDLALLVTARKRKALSSGLSRPSFSDLAQHGQITINPIQVRSELVTEIMPNFIEVGLSRQQIIDLCAKQPDEISQAYRLVGWLLGQEPMADFKSKLKKSRPSTKQGNLHFEGLLARIQDEVGRQIQIHSSSMAKSGYDERISYETQAYDEESKNFHVMEQMCEVVFPRAIERLDRIKHELA